VTLILLTLFFCDDNEIFWGLEEFMLGKDIREKVKYILF